MSYNKRQKESVIDNYKWPIYTKPELEAFAQWLLKFKGNLNEARVADGAMSKKIQHGQTYYCVRVTLKEYKDGHGVYDGPIKYQLFEHKLQALEKMNYGDTVALQSLASYAPPEIVETSADYNLLF